MTQYLRPTFQKQTIKDNINAKKMNFLTTNKPK